MKGKELAQLCVAEEVVAELERFFKFLLVLT